MQSSIPVTSGIDFNPGSESPYSNLISSAMANPGNTGQNLGNAAIQGYNQLYSSAMSSLNNI